MAPVDNSEIFEAFAPDMKSWYALVQRAINEAFDNYTGNPGELIPTPHAATLASRTAVDALVPHIVRRLQVSQLGDLSKDSPELQSWYDLAWAALLDEFDNYTGGPNDAIHMDSQTLFVKAAETAVKAVYPYILSSRSKPEYPGLTPNDIFVSKHYEMDPETEDVIPTGEHLTIGMRVLIEHSEKRIDIDATDRLMPPRDVELARRWNRWGKVVSYPEVTDGSEIYFIIEYDDRTKKQMRLNKYSAWIVKKDTMPPTVELDMNFEEPTVLFKNDQGLIEQMPLAEFSDLFKKDSDTSTVESEIVISPKDAGQPIVVYTNDQGEVGQMPLGEFQSQFEKDPSVFEPKIAGGYITYSDGSGGTETWSFEEFTQIFTNMMHDNTEAGLALGPQLGFSTTLPGPESTQHHVDEPQDSTPSWVKATEAKWNRVKGTTTNLYPGSQQT